MYNMERSNETGESAYNFAYGRRLPNEHFRVSISTSKRNPNQQTNKLEAWYRMQNAGTTLRACLCDSGRAMIWDRMGL